MATSRATADDYLSGALSFGFGLDLFAGMAQAASITCPVLVIHGGKDRLTEVSGAHMLHDKVGSSDKTIRIWPEAYHELHNEPEKAEVLTTITDWMTARLP